MVTVMMVMIIFSPCAASATPCKQKKSEKKPRLHQKRQPPLKTCNIHKNRYVRLQLTFPLDHPEGKKKGKSW